MEKCTEYNNILIFKTQQQQMYRLERRPGIEIIPIPSQPTQSLKSSVTITPINSTSKNSSSAGASGEKRTGANNGNEHGSSSSSSSSSKRSENLSSESVRLKLEKKKKRKREDCPMGPPEKMPGKCFVSCSFIVSLNPIKTAITISQF